MIMGAKVVVWIQQLNAMVLMADCKRNVQVTGVMQTSG